MNIYWQQAAKEAGFHFTREHGLAIRSLATKYTGPYLQKIFGPEFDYEAIRARRKQLMKEHIEKNGIEKKPDVDEILDYLRSKNIKTAVATATDPERTKQYLTQIGIYDKFDQLVSATTVENGKPEPAVYLYACETKGLHCGGRFAKWNLICIPRRAFCCDGAGSRRTGRGDSKTSVCKI